MFGPGRRSTPATGHPTASAARSASDTSLSLSVTRSAVPPCATFVRQSLPAVRRIDTALVRIQDEFHGAGRRHPSNRLRRMLYVETWFKNHATTKAGR